MKNSNKIQNIKDLNMISEMLALEVEGFSDQQLIDDCKNNGKDSASLIKSTRNILSDAVKKSRQKNLESARENYNKKAKLLSGQNMRVHSSPAERKKLFETLLSKLPSLDPGFALQFREYKTMSDEDIVSVLEQAEALGFLDGIDE
ncbi:MAG: hypothetical protein V4596_01880 [Bdellovibrionota bacterium]